MAVDLWPYSQRQSGTVNDAEHETLWSALADGVLPEEPTSTLTVSAGAGVWTVQPGKILVAGHVLHVDSVQSGTLPASATSTRRSIVSAYVDRSKSPWQYGVRLVPGTPGAGRPALSTSRTGIYEVALRAFDIAPNGAVSLLPDERPFLRKTGRKLLLPAQGLSSSDETTASESWQTGASACEATFVAPPSGQAIVRTYAYGNGTGSNALALAFSIRRGSAAGLVIYAPATYDGPIIGSSRAGVEASKLVTGLVPGESYYIRTVHRSTATGAAATVFQRRLLVEPVAS